MGNRLEGGMEMSIQDLMARLGDKSDEGLQKAVQCGSTKELIDLFRKYGMELPEEAAAELMNALHLQEGGLPDRELEGITGGLQPHPGSQPTQCPRCGCTLILHSSDGCWCSECGTTFGC